MNHPLNERIDSRGNNFDLLRLFAASAVIFSHSFGLVTRGGHAGSDPLYVFTAGQMTFGELGVFIFFVTSGFLITPSLLRSRNSLDYFTKRVLRILPGLLFVVLFAIFILGALFTTWSLSDYFHSMTTYRYLVNVTMFGSQASLPGVFVNTPLPEMVNGSLWTLKFEFFCYVLLAALSMFRMLNARIVLIGALMCALVGKLYSGPGYGYIFYSSFFLAGAALYMWRKSVFLNRRNCVYAFVFLAIGGMAGWLKVSFAIGGAYLIIYLAYSSDLGDRFRKHFGDYSYGIYLFGFPIQQAVVSIVGEGATWWKEFFLSYPIALAFAIISWKFVESPALKLRERLRLANFSEKASSVSQKV
jgi:peptidoglycan/LPS O-acetylase OafA/YrhL